jgi:hypothetical protein
MAFDWSVGYTQPIQKKNRRKTSQKPKPVFENAFRGKSHLTLVLPSKSLLKKRALCPGPGASPFLQGHVHSGHGYACLALFF